MSKRLEIDFCKCKPGECDPGKGICRAQAACTHKLLEQEEKGEPPMLVASSMCKACGKCVEECPLKALSIRSGS